MAVEITKKIIEYFLERITLFVSFIYIWFFLGIFTGMILFQQELSIYAVIPLIIALIAFYSRIFSVLLFILFLAFFFLI